MERGKRRVHLLPKLVLILGVVCISLLCLYSNPTILTYWDASLQPVDALEDSAWTTENDLSSNFDSIFNYNFTNITRPPANFLVWSSTCHMPNVDPFTDDVMKVYKPQELVACSDLEPYVEKLFDHGARRYRLQINLDLMSSYVGEKDAMSCCYKEVVRAGKDSQADNDYRLLECIPFYHEYVVPIHIEGMLVECRSVAYNKLVYRDAFSFVQEKSDVRRRLSAQDGLQPGAEKFGVLLIGIDSLSRFNFRRTMPLTFTHLQKEHWFEMAGYNKMGDNTFPNIMAIATGLDPALVEEECQPTTVGGLDNCTTIWKLYRNGGFATAYSEDEPWMSTFNYLKRGFLNPPTDYYQRPFFLAIDRTMPNKKVSGLSVCIGVRRTADYVYGYGMEFVQRFLGERFFGLFWTNSFSHNSYDDPSSMDEPMLRYLEEMKRTGVLDSAVVIFFSDHGSRWGTLRNLPQGFLEERLPMLFIWLPAWLRRKHPDFVYALEVNRNRLTSPYDLHLTLKHLLALATGDQEPWAPAKSCPQCQSLLRPVPPERSCEEAGIDEHWCTCVPYEAVSIYSDLSKGIAELVIDRINAHLAAKELSQLCSVLKLKHVQEVSKKVDLSGTSTNSTASYRVRFEADPNEAEFEATLEYRATDPPSIDLDVESVSRLNAYADDAACIEQKEAKKFCVCQSAVRPSD